jgi:hypothetical protein
VFSLVGALCGEGADASAPQQIGEQQFRIHLDDFIAFGVAAEVESERGFERKSIRYDVVPKTRQGHVKAQRVDVITK